MGTCKYCGKPAGFLSSKHSECEQKNHSGRQQIVFYASQTLDGSLNIDTLVEKIEEVKKSCYIPPNDIKALLVYSWEKSVKQFLNDGLLDKGEDKRLIELQNRFNLSQDDLNRNGAYIKIGKASILRDVLNGELPQREVNIIGPLAPNLQKGEKVIFAFGSSSYSEDKTSQEYVGGSQGVSIRVLKGVYYRLGSFKGHTVKETKLVYIDTGTVTLTNKHIYFTGQQKSIRIRYTKIVTFQPFSDGIGIILDNAAAKRIVFRTGDGWFTYNLVTNLSRL